MLHPAPDDTIIALSSAPGGRAIFRLSGPGAWTIAESLSPGTKAAPASARRVRMRLPQGSLWAWAYGFIGPRSYTGEDLVEFHLPPGNLLTRLVLRQALALGARLAEPGEFTSRAYFNRRLDLAQAEGVAALIHAGNRQQMQAARQLLAGELSRRLRPMMDELARTLALVEVGIDFSDEDVVFLPSEQVHERAAVLDRQLADLLQESGRFEKLSAEPVLVLAGRPNAGKSTLLNALAGCKRAVVSAQAGTTRDVLSVEVHLARGRIRLIDAAGLESADAGDEIEAAMRRRTLQAVADADAVIWVADASDPDAPVDLGRELALIVHTKADLYPSGPAAVSAVTGAGLDALRQQLDQVAFGPDADLGARLTLNARHVQAIRDAREAMGRVAREASPELLAMELRQALDDLGQILGIVTPDDVLGLVFSQFCIGK